MCRWNRGRRANAESRITSVPPSRALRLGGSLLAAAVGVLLAASPAAALSIATNPVAFDNGTDAGTITLLGTATGVPTGGGTLAGTVGGTDISLIFEASVTVGSVDSIGVGVFQPPFTGVISTGAGNVPNVVGVDISGVSGGAGTRIFEFSSNLDVGETSDAFFVSYASLKTDGTQFVNFMISPASGASDFTVSVALVPEPSTLLLFGLGAAGLAGASRRHAARSGGSSR